MHDPKKFASRERLGYLRGLADQRSLAGNELSQQIRNLLDDKRSAERQRRQMEVAAGMVRRGYEEKHQQLTELIDVMDLDLAELTPRRDRLSAEHQQTRGAYTRARTRALELGLPIPGDHSGDEFAPEPTKQTAFDDGAVKMRS